MRHEITEAIIIMFIVVILILMLVTLRASSSYENIQKQAIQYGYAHYVGEDHKWERIKPEGVK